ILRPLSSFTRSDFFSFFILLPQLPKSTLFPYTTLFRSAYPRISQISGRHFRILLNRDLGLLNLRMPPLLPLEAKEPTVADLRVRSEEHTSELQSRGHLVCRLLLEKKKAVHYDVACERQL